MDLQKPVISAAYPRATTTGARYSRDRDRPHLARVARTGGHLHLSVFAWLPYRHPIGRPVGGPVGLVHGLGCASSAVMMARQGLGAGVEGPYRGGSGSSALILLRGLVAAGVLLPGPTTPR